MTDIWLHGNNKIPICLRKVIWWWIKLQVGWDFTRSGCSHNLGGGEISPLNGLSMEPSATLSWQNRGRSRLWSGYLPRFHCIFVLDVSWWIYLPMYSLLNRNLNDREPFLRVFLVPDAVDIAGTRMTCDFVSLFFHVGICFCERFIETIVWTVMFHAKRLWNCR